MAVATKKTAPADEEWRTAGESLDSLKDADGDVQAALKAFCRSRATAGYISHEAASLERERGENDRVLHFIAVLGEPLDEALRPEVYVVGAKSALGKWDVAKAPRMRAIAPEILAVSVHLSAGAPGTNEYKYVLRAKRTVHERKVESTHWEELSGNRTLPDFGDTYCDPDERFTVDRYVRFGFGAYPGSITFKMHYTLPPDEVLCITGDPAELGGWMDPGAVEMALGTDDEPLPAGLEGVGRYWSLTIERPPVHSFDYRYVVRNTNSGGERWEREPNRRFKPLLRYITKSNSIAESNASGDSMTVVNAAASPHFEVVDVNFVSRLEFDAIGDKNLVIGPYPQSVEDIEKLEAFGVTAVLSVQTDGDIKVRKLDWPSMLDLYQEHGISVSRVAIEDFSPKSLEDNLLAAAEELAKLRDSGYAVYVHCTAGMSRAAATVITYLVLHTQQFSSPDDAYTFVKQHRSVIAPNMRVVRDVVRKAQEEAAATSAAEKKASRSRFDPRRYCAVS